MNITFVMLDATANDEARELLRGFGMPFQAEKRAASIAAARQLSQ